MSTLLEDGDECAAEALGVELGQLADQDEVDQILDPGAFPLVLPIGAGVGMKLLGNVLLKRNDRQLRRCDVCELQRVRCKKRLRLDRRRFAEGDVGGELLEAAAVQVGADGVADGAKAGG